MDLQTDVIKNIQATLVSKLFKLGVGFLFISLLSSCSFPEHYFTKDPICIPTSALFPNQNQLSPANQAHYIGEFLSLKPAAFRYYFKGFVEDGNDTFMITNFRNDAVCFDIKVLVDKWDKLGGMRRTNGRAYPNELYDLQWSIEDSNGEKQIKYIDMHKIID